jgi:hypothetical protein
MFILVASAIFGLVIIFPRFYRNKRYKESISYHEIIIDKKPFESLRTSVCDWFKRFRERIRNGEHYDEILYHKFREKWKSEMSGESIQDVEVYSAYMFAEKLNHMVVWVRLSLVLLVVARLLDSLHSIRASSEFAKLLNSLRTRRKKDKDN